MDSAGFVVHSPQNQDLPHSLLNKKTTMIESMTGFGASRMENDKIAVSVEVKTLNSKFLDTFVRLPHLFSSKEIETKNLIGDYLKRGKVSLNLNYTSKVAVSEVRVNQEVVGNYYQTLKQAADKLGANTQDLFRIVMTMPEAYTNDSDEEKVEEVWKEIRKAIVQALEACQQFRLQEGEKLAQEFRGYIANIGQYLKQTAERDPARMAHIREKLQKQVADLTNHEKFDPNRFEQELIYYIEKLDISEEKVRLQNHLDYFLETLASPKSNGKKLGFISQEIGREINTIGSKANDAEIQKLVVNMKEELEKVKEQVLNVV